MKVLLKYLMFLFLIGFLFSACSKENSNLTAPQTISVHPNGWTNPNSSVFHGNFIRKSNWDLKQCQQCHAANFRGGITDVSCYTCHKNSEGPEACNTCHGNFNDSTKIAPPRATNGDTSSTYRGVGAHVPHLYNDNLTDNVKCAECHVVPKNFDDPTHINSNHRAAVIFGTLAKNNGANPVYNYDSLKCTNVYCHGDFKFSKDSSSYAFIYTDSVIAGNNFSPEWTELNNTQAKCGTCHSLPPKGHLNAGNDPTASTCYTCHSGVVDANGNIINKNKHINGKINVFGN